VEAEPQTQKALTHLLQEVDLLHTLQLVEVEAEQELPQTVVLVVQVAEVAVMVQVVVQVTKAVTAQ
jgi:hypothetical protein